MTAEILVRSCLAKDASLVASVVQFGARRNPKTLEERMNANSGQWLFSGPIIAG
jgi:hypothetical protein